MTSGHGPIRRAFTAIGLIVLLAASSATASNAARASAAYPLSCRYFLADLDLHPRCARREGAMVRIAPPHAARLHYRRGLSEAAIDGIGWLWVRRDGLALPVFLLDNGPDPFVGGLTRGQHNGRVAFYDRRLRLALATPYDWSFPFNARGEALVCTGCRSDGRTPSAMVGGRWGVIDRRGRLLDPLSENDAASRRYFGR